ncbi:MAG: hypothetical protein ACP5DC_00860 [Halothiobacillaceae bacterium]
MIPAVTGIAQPSTDARDLQCGLGAVSFDQLSERCRRGRTGLVRSVPPGFIVWAFHPGVSAQWRRFPAQGADALPYGNLEKLFEVPVQRRKPLTCRAWAACDLPGTGRISVGQAVDVNAMQ